MSETPHESQPVLVPRSNGEIQVWHATNLFDNKGRQFAESPDGVAKALGSHTLSPEGQAALAEELAMSIERTPEPLGHSEQLVEAPVVKKEPSLTQRLHERLSGGSVDIDTPPESPEAKEKRIKQYTLQTMGSLLDGVASHAEGVEHSDDHYSKRVFNEAMVSNMADLKARLDNELTTPEGAAMMSGLFIGATTDSDATVAVFRTLEQSGMLPEEDIFEIRQALRDLESISRNPQDAAFRQRVIGSLNDRGDKLLFADEANKKLGAAYIGMAAGIAIGSRNYAVISDQHGGAMNRLSQL